MNRVFSSLSRTEATISALAASTLSVVTIGIVLGAFATVAPVPAGQPVTVFEHVTISAARSA